MGVPERLAHLAESLDDVRLGNTIGRSSGRRECRGRSTEEIGSLGVWVNGTVHLYSMGCRVYAPEPCGKYDLPRNKSRTGGSVGRASSRCVFRSDIGAKERLEEGGVLQADSWFIYGNTAIAC